MEELEIRENARNGILNRISYAASKEINKNSRKYFLQEIKLKSKIDSRERYLTYIHQYKPPDHPSTNQNNSIFYNPAIAKASVLGLIGIVIIAIILGVTLS